VLIDLGIAYFSRQGFHATGLKELLAAGDIPKGSFYNYFDSKESFAAEVIAAQSAQSIELFDSVALEHASEPAIERLRAVHRSLTELHEQTNWSQGCLLGNMAAEFASSSELCAAAVDTGVESWRVRITELFAEGQIAGEVRTDVSASDLAFLFWNSWQGALLAMQYQQSGDGLSRTVDLALDHFVAAQPSLANA